MPDDEDMSDAKPDEVAGDYPHNHWLPGAEVVLRGVLGRGGHATVYKAEQPLIGKFVALKVLHEYLKHDTELGQRIIEEARTLARLEHPNIVRVLSAGYTRDERNLPWIMLELLEGSTGRLLLERKLKLPIPNALDILIPLASGLALAHANGVIHQDLKPENIFIHRSRGQGAITKLCDFSIQRKLLAGIASEGKIEGTLAYAAPEQLRGEQLSVAADIYAFGIVLFEFLVGVRPFHEAEEQDRQALEVEGASLGPFGSSSGSGGALQRSWIVSRKLSDKPAPELHLYGRYPPPLEKLVAECLERDPAKRPKSMTEVAERLTTILRELGPSFRRQTTTQDILITAVREAQESKPREVVASPPPPPAPAPVPPVSPAISVQRASTPSPPQDWRGTGTLRMDVAQLAPVQASTPLPITATRPAEAQPPQRTSAPPQVLSAVGMNVPEPRASVHSTPVTPAAEVLPLASAHGASQSLATPVRPPPPPTPVPVAAQPPIQPQSIARESQDAAHMAEPMRVVDLHPLPAAEAPRAEEPVQTEPSPRPSSVPSPALTTSTGNPTRRIALIGATPELTRWIKDGLDSSDVTLLEVDEAPPDATSPDAVAAAQSIADRHEAIAIAWVERTSDSAKVWFFVEGADPSLRSLPLHPSFLAGEPRGVSSSPTPVPRSRLSSAPQVAMTAPIETHAHRRSSGAASGETRYQDSLLSVQRVERSTRPMEISRASGAPTPSRTPETFTTVLPQIADEKRLDDAAPKAAFPLRRTRRIVATVTGLLVPLAAFAIWNAVAHRTGSEGTQVAPPPQSPSALTTPARAPLPSATPLLPGTLPAPSSIGAAATADAGASPLDAGARHSAPHHGSRPAAPAAPAPAPASSHDPLSDWLERSK